MKKSLIVLLVALIAVTSVFAQGATEAQAATSTGPMKITMLYSATQTEAGAYKVEGEWTFTATKTGNKKGALVDVVRYSVETLVNGAWTNKQIFNGNTYTYTEGTSPATVRLKWLGQPIGTAIIVQ